MTITVENAPKTMAEALDWDDPADALLNLANCSTKKAEALSLELHDQLSQLSLSSTISPNNNNTRESLNACADSILHSLTKIASGGSEASQEIRVLEEEKRNVELHCADVETALLLRNCSLQASHAMRSNNLKGAAMAVEQYNAQNDRKTPRALAYAGESCIQQMDATQTKLKTTLLSNYKSAVAQGNLQILGELTPLLQMVDLQDEGVSLYMEYLSQTIKQEWPAAASKPLPNQQLQSDEQPPLYIQMARIYNCAVSTLRHHLPMLSMCLYKADGDVALIQLVHSQVEHYVIPLLNQYVRQHELHTIAHHAQLIYGELEALYTSGMLLEKGGDEQDCGFSTQVGTMSQVNAALEEAALCLQHAESYTRFISHSIEEVNKARKLRFQQVQDQLKVERERQEWTTGIVVAFSEQEFQKVEILDAHTQLHQVVAEVGGYYCGIERCLLLASMTRAFGVVEPFSPAIEGTNHSQRVGSKALKTALVEKCLYAARHGMQRAFATGHVGTAAACTNFCCDIMGGVLVQNMAARTQESGVALLKPGEGLLLAGSSSTVSNLIRQGQNAAGGVIGHSQSAQHAADEAQRQLQIQEGIAKACASLNDLHVAHHHTKQLERLLMESIEKGYPAHDAEQLRLCVKSFGPVADSFQTASDSAVESLVSVLSTRVRSIVSDAVGSEGSAASASFMGSSVAVMGGHAVDRVTVRMNYNLTDQDYQLLQLSEGYMARMCLALDELIQPLCIHLVPKLSDATVLGLIGLAAKRIESAIRRCKFTSLGALSLDSDMRDLMSFVKDCLDSPDLKSNVSLYRACTPLARLMQIAKLMNVDDLEDVLDLISASKRKGNWDLKLEDAKAFLSLRVEFEGRKVNELLRISEDE